jgi:hypothetical protein
MTLQRNLMLGLLACCSGACAITSPYWGYEPESTSAPIPFQAWTVDKAHPIQLECAQETNAHGAPAKGDASYIHVTDLAFSGAGSMDPSGYQVFSAAALMALPKVCWRYFPEYDHWQTTLRMTQMIQDEKRIYSSFDQAGLECLGRENGKAHSWFGFRDKCEMRDLSGNQKMPHIVLRIKGYAAGAHADTAAL